jgi:uncharacterized protein YutD
MIDQLVMLKLFVRDQERDNHQHQKTSHVRDYIAVHDRALGDIFCLCRV